MRKRVLVLIDSWYPRVSGGPVHVWELCQKLTGTYGYQVTILTRDLSGSEDVVPKVPRDLRNVLTVIRMGPKGHWEHSARRVWYLAQCTYYGLTHEFDIVHVHAFSPCLVGKFLSMVKQKPVIVTVHGTRLLTKAHMGHGWADRLFRTLEQWFLLSVQYDHTISVDSAFLRLENVNRSVTVIPNGVHIPKKRVRAKWDGLRLLYIGRLEIQKGLRYLLEALISLSHSCPRLSLTIVGTGSQEQPLRDFTKRHGLDEIVRFVGEQPPSCLAEYYTNADVFVLPSLYEGHSLALLDALSYGLCAIATDVGATRETVVNEITGLLVEPESSVALASAVQRLYGKKFLLTMGNRARLFIAKHFSWDRTAKETDQVYRKVLSQ